MKNKASVFSSLALLGAVAGAISIPATAHSATYHAEETPLDGFANAEFGGTVLAATALKPIQGIEFFPTSLDTNANNLLSDPALQPYLQSAREKNRILTNAMLGDQAPNTPWNITPVRRDDGTAVCVAAIKDSIKNAELRNLDGSILTAQEKEALSFNTMSIIAHNGDVAHIRLGFDALGTMIKANGADHVGIAGYSDLPSVVTTQSALLAHEGVTITARSTNDHIITYNMDAPLPLEALNDCNEAAQNGDFDEALASIDPTLIAEIHIPAAQAAQQNLQNGFKVGGLCHKGFEPKIFGRITRAGFYTPATYVGFDANGQMQSGDLIRATASNFTRSASLDNPLASPETSGCTGNVKPVCSTQTIDINPDTGDTTVTYRFCEAGAGAGLGGYGADGGHGQIHTIEPSHITAGSTTITTTTAIPTDPATPLLPFDPLNPLNPVNPFNPFNPIDPIKPTTPSQVSATPAALSLLTGLAAIFGIRATSRRKEEKSPSRSGNFNKNRTIMAPA